MNITPRRAKALVSSHFFQGVKFSTVPNGFGRKRVAQQAPSRCEEKKDPSKPGVLHHNVREERSGRLTRPQKIIDPPEVRRVTGLRCEFTLFV
jgi:hypothetical protein